MRVAASFRESPLLEKWAPCMSYLNKVADLITRLLEPPDAGDTWFMQSRDLFLRQYDLRPDQEQLFQCLTLVDKAICRFQGARSTRAMTLASRLTLAKGWRCSLLYLGWAKGWIQSDVALNEARSTDEAWACETGASRAMLASVEAHSDCQFWTPFRVLGTVYQHAFLIYLEEQRLQELWECTQRGKGRRLCEQLGVEDLPQAGVGERTLSTMLAANASAPVGIHQMRDLALKLKKECPGRNVVFVDWVEWFGAFWLVVLGGDNVSPSVTECTLSVQEVTAWRNKWLDAEPGDESALQKGDLHAEDDGDFCLRGLDGLVAPLERLSQPGDLLIFSPTGVLHSVPLHALWVPSRVLILERNPIVYSASLTTFWQCSLRAQATAQIRRDDPRRGHDRRWAYAGVYEKGAGRFFSADEQDKVYKLIPETADMRSSKCVESAIGTKVTRQWAREALEQSSLFLFFGHCQLDSTDVTMQGLEVGDGVLSVREVLEMNLLDAHVGLVACESASQTQKTGGEPWGMATAFLCAGAVSVLTSMWPTAPQAGRCFTSEMYKGLDEGGGTDGLVDMAERTRRAVLALRRETETSQPCHWAAFVLHGSWAMYA
ncbi:hypothetical protein E4U41_006622 [Claviceps citrina]|nr:hypothetical protein E4U41_006622 [Claviceps citrina]